MMTDQDGIAAEIGRLVSNYTDNVRQAVLPLMADGDLRRLTPVLSKAALAFDPLLPHLYSFWSEDILDDLIDRLEYPDGSTPGPEDWAVLHADIECSILGGMLHIGDPLGIGELLLQDPTAYGLALRGCLSFIQDEPEQTIGRYEGALAQLRKETGQQSVVIPGIPVLFYALALIRQRDIKSLTELLFTEASRIEKLHGHDRLTPVLRILADFTRVACGQIEFNQSPWLNHDAVTNDPWLDLFQGLVLYWLNKRPNEKQIRRLMRHTTKALDCNIFWYVNEATALLDMLGINTDKLNDDYDADPGNRLVSLYQVRPSWEAHLAALNLISEHHASQGKGSKNQTADRRMVWWIQGEGSFMFLEPREQKRNKKGTWTKGRKVSLKRLREELQTFDYLGPEDLKICAAITEDHHRNYGYYLETIYELEGEQALSAAIGHPRLYRGDMDGRDGQTVTVEEAPPRLEVIEDKERETIQIQMFPYPDTRLDYLPDFLCQWLDRHRLQITWFSEEQLDITRTLTAQGLIAPLSAKEQILHSLAGMAPLVMIHSDIGGGTEGDAQEIPANTTLHFHLHPVKQDGEFGIEAGLHLSLHCKPLGEKGPSFRPGEGRAALFGEVEGQPCKTVRDLKQELEQARNLVDRLPLEASEAPWQWPLDDPEQALETLLALQEMGDEVVIAWPQGKKLTLTREIGSSQMQVGIRKQRDWFGLDGELQVDEGQVLEMDKLLRLIQQTPGRFLRLDDGRILTLSKQLRHQLDSLNSIRDQGKIHPLATAVVEEATDGMLVKGGKPWREQLARLREAESLQPQVPTTLQAELRDYQIDGFCWLARLAHWGAGACLADDMGLGKTLQALTLMIQRAPDGPALVVAPTSVCNNWIEETQRFAPTMNPQRFGDGDRQQILDAAGPYDLIICSYGLLQSESERISQIRWQTIVADEAQAFKNAQTKRSKAVMSLQGACRVITTGTPIENHLGELWNLFRFINPGLLGSRERFNERFANPIELHKDDQARLRLRALIRPFILRRLKSEVLTELPARTEITHYVEFKKEESSFYEALRRRAMQRIAELPEHPGQQRFKILTEITRLRQAACHPRLVIENSPVGSAKMRAFIEILEELRENRHHALVFSQFVSHLTLIREYLDQQQVHYQYLDGSTSVLKRKQAVDAFQRGEGELFLISLKAGGSGLNLTAADYVIHMDPWWNPAVEDQASDRAHRIGQTRPVTIYRLVVKGTIEEKIVGLHAHKRDLADGLLEGTDTSVRLSVDDLVDLISGDSNSLY